MGPRVPYYDIAPDGMKIIMDMEKYTKKTAIERKLRELIKIRVSQINGCDNTVLNMHIAMHEKWVKQNKEYTVLVLGKSVNSTQK